jgi:hypothetical protein
VWKLISPRSLIESSVPTMYVMAGIVAFGVKLSGRPRWADALPLAGTGRMMDAGWWPLAMDLFAA